MSTAEAPPSAGAQPGAALESELGRPSLIEPAPPLPPPGSDARAQRWHGFRAGYRGWPVTSDIATTRRSLAAYERGARLRAAAIFLGRWYPGCGISVEPAEREAARAAAWAWVARGGGVDPSRPVPIPVQHAMEGRLERAAARRRSPTTPRASAAPAAQPAPA